MTVSTNYSASVPASSLQSSTSAGAASSTAASSASATPGSGAAVTTLTSLAGNFNDFLTLLTTQLQNQDPTAPLDTNQFTSQLVQFTGVAEQIQTNSTLSSILTANLSQQLTDASNLVGRNVTINGGTLPLQSGTASLAFQTQSAEPVMIAVQDSGGNAVYSQTVSAAAGSNSWSWNGHNSAGQQEPDGAYKVSVTDLSGNAVPFQANGTVTGAEQVNQAVDLQFGATTVPFGNIATLGATSSAAGL